MIEFKSDGAITLTFPEGKVTLKPPTLGQLRTLRNLGVSFSEQMVEPDAQELRDEWAVKWLGAAVTELADRPVEAEPDDWPAWTANGALPARMVSHWLTFPLDSLPPQTGPLGNRR